MINISFSSGFIGIKSDWPNNIQFDNIWIKQEKFYETNWATSKVDKWSIN